MLIAFSSYEAWVFTLIAGALLLLLIATIFIFLMFKKPKEHKEKQREAKAKISADRKLQRSKVKKDKKNKIETSPYLINERDFERKPFIVQKEKIEKKTTAIRTVFTGIDEEIKEAAIPKKDKIEEIVIYDDRLSDSVADAKFLETLRNIQSTDESPVSQDETAASKDKNKTPVTPGEAWELFTGHVDSDGKSIVNSGGPLVSKKTTAGQIKKIAAIAKVEDTTPDQDANIFDISAIENSPDDPPPAPLSIEHNHPDLTPKQDQQQNIPEVVEEENNWDDDIDDFPLDNYDQSETIDTINKLPHIDDGALADKYQTGEEHTVVAKPPSSRPAFIKPPAKPSEVTKSEYKPVVASVKFTEARRAPAGGKSVDDALNEYKKLFNIPDIIEGAGGQIENSFFGPEDDLADMEKLLSEDDSSTLGIQVDYPEEYKNVQEHSAIFMFDTDNFPSELD